MAVLHGLVANSVAFICTLSFFGWHVHIVFAQAFDRYLLSVFTPMLDLPEASKSRQSPKLEGIAVIAGGSMTGLICARILSTHFQRVVVIEQEKIEEGVERKAIGQRNSYHILSMMTPAVFTALFHNFEAEVRKAGGIVGPVKAKMCLDGEYMLPAQSQTIWPWKTLGFTMKAAEELLRRLVREQCPSVEFINAHVTGFDYDQRTNCVRGINFTDHGSAKLDTLSCDFLVDATGYAHASVRWLQAAGFPSVPQSSYSPWITYRTVIVPSTASIRSAPWPLSLPWEETALILAHAAQPPSKLEAMFCGQATEKCPRVEELLEFCATFPEMSFLRDVIPELLDEAHRADRKISKWQSPHCVRYDFGAVPLPSNFVALGDAAVSKNPIYGQGITQACIESVTLDALLRQPMCQDCIPTNFSNVFYRKASPRIKHFWTGTKANDYGMPTCDRAAGEAPTTGWFERALSKRVIRLSHTDNQAGIAFWESLQGLRPPTDLLAPTLIFKMLRSVIKDLLSGRSLH